MRYILVGFLFVLISACSTKRTVKSDDALQVISIEEVTKDIDDNLITDRSEIKLELTDSSTLGPIDKVIIHKGKIYVLDIRVTKSLYIFNLEGKILRRIHSIGEAEGQFYLPFDFNINQFSDEINILDVRQRRMLNYSLDGDFKNQHKINGQISDFASLNKDRFVFHMDGRQNDPTERKEFLQVANKSNDSTFLSGVSEYGSTDYVKIFNSLTFSNKRLLYMQSMHDSIYVVTENEIKPIYSIDFNGHGIPSDIKRKDPMDLRQALITGDYYIVSGNLFESNKLLTFSWERTSKIDPETIESVWTIFNKNTDKSLSLTMNRFKEKHRFGPAQFARDGYFYSVNTLESRSVSDAGEEENPTIVQYKINF
ncbi:6-bladed beta-propeller [Roseivirga echinicomitans]|uniref:6-bladed beta-propeller n=1 Tax=Roseivirga echinicomitans TaxID=296218 RepID=A0A150XVU3_9BACT|nr:6-bladed beta-propeller [Roseivirga echinicomitans]KYG82881.1 hypothetical protein AWN68_13955 [Roseivirga echinicomitans]